ncbi:MAG: hypothetical protein IJH35_01785 [Methanobrevibacter sp.]|nr:hypothetical protein [Methanobrevibacter sp.]
MYRLLHSDELLQKYSLTSGIVCEDCGFGFTEDVLGFYFNTEHGQIEEHLIVMLSGNIDSPIKGVAYNSYCKECNKFISTYRIENLNDEYDMEAAYYLTRLLLPRQLDFASKRLEIYKSIAGMIKAGDLEDLEKDLRVNRRYYEDLFSGLEGAESFKELLFDEDFPDEALDIDEYVYVYEKEVYRLKNTVYSINIGDESFNFTLDGEKLPVDICPNCKNKVKGFDFFDLESCPNCGGKHIIHRIGANYD